MTERATGHGLRGGDRQRETVGIKRQVVERHIRALGQQVLHQVTYRRRWGKGRFARHTTNGTADDVRNVLDER